MYKFFLTIAFVVFCGHIYAQEYPAHFNLINDPGLEAKDYANARDTDLNNSCWVRAGISQIPFQFHPSDKAFPHTGKKYLSIYQTNKHVRSGKPVVIQDTSNDAPDRNYVESRLITPLHAGETYYFSIWIGTIKDKANASIRNPPVIFSNLGVTFTSSQIKEYSNAFLTPASPIIDLSNWDIATDNEFTYTKVSASFVARGGEQYMTIGNFDYYSQFKVIFSKDTGYSYSPTVIVIDDLSLTKDTTQAIISLDGFQIGKDTVLCNKDTLTIGGPAYYLSYLWNTGDTSRLLKVTTPGKYWCKASFACNPSDRFFTDPGLPLHPLLLSLHCLRLCSSLS